MASAAPRSVTFDDLFRVRWLDDPQISTDGLRIAFTVSALDRERDALTTSVYVCNTEPPTVARPPVRREVVLESGVLLPAMGEAWRAGPDGFQCRSPRWSPDGEHLSVLAGEVGSEQLWVMAADGSGTEDTGSAGGIRETCWSPDGQYIAYTASGNRHRQLWTIGVDGADAACISYGAWDDSAPAWSPNGREIVFLSRRASPFADIWLTTPAGGPPRRLSHGAGPIRALAWSPDSQWIAYIGHSQGHAQGVNFALYVIGSDGSQARELGAQLDRSIGQVVRADDLRGMEPPSLAWSPDGKRIYFAFANGGVSHIGWATLDEDTGIAVDGERACLTFSVAARVDRIAFIASDALNPGEVHTATGDGQCERRLTSFNDEWLRELTLSKPERMRFACDDGQAIEGWLMRPPGWSCARRYPLILQIHGGPHYPLGERFYFDFQRLAALGYIVLYCNPRGSQGYGEQFATCIRGAWGERDYRDLMQAVDVAAGFAEVDESRLAVTGVSYGGYMTNWLIGHTQRFRTSICENGISNLASNFTTSVHGAEFWTWELCGTPASQPERYQALSPISYADQIHTPLLLIHAEQDENCAIAQSEELYTVLHALDRQVSLVRIPVEGHLMNLAGKPSARLLRMAAIDEWLARWL